MIKSDRGQLFDFSLFFSAIALWVIGILLVFSATHIHQTGPLAGIYKSQILWVTMGVLIILLVVSIPPSLFYNLAYVFYGLSLLLLTYVIFTGVVSKGAGRWIAVGPIRLQPSEFAKIGLLLALARYLSRHTITLERISSFVVPGLLILVPFALVMKQPDLGTALVFCTMSLPMFFWAGLSLKEVFLLVSPGISLVLSLIPLILAFSSDSTMGIGGAVPWGLFFLFFCVFVYFVRPHPVVLVGTILANLLVAATTNILWNSFLQDYQKMRVLSFIDPQRDPFGAGYQVIQSKVAVGSGHIFGKGYLQGTQTRLSFLPEQHTDFIFSVLGEQFGFIGCVVVLLLFLFMIARCFGATQVIKNRFINLVIVGAASIITFHVFVNVAMILGMMPVTGLPLPFLSYGGSFTFTTAILIGLILNGRLGRLNF